MIPLDSGKTVTTHKEQTTISPHHNIWSSLCAANDQSLAENSRRWSGDNNRSSSLDIGSALNNAGFQEKTFYGHSASALSQARELGYSGLWNGSTFTPAALPEDHARRHSFTAAPSRSLLSPSSYSAIAPKTEPEIAPLKLSQALETVYDYFEADPHNRVHVTSNLLHECYTTGEYCINSQFHARQGGCMALPSCSSEVLATLGLFRLVLVAFKLGRVDVFYIESVNGTQKLFVGDLVIVEADRGRDLGRVARLDLSVDEARLLKLLHFQEQQAAFSASLNRGHCSSAGEAGSASVPAVTSFPKCVLGLAQPHEIMQVLTKIQDEDRACRLCLAKISMAIGILGLPKSSSTVAQTPASFASGGQNSAQKQQDLLQMQLVDVEYQFDRKKLIFYYSTAKRIDFRELVRELFRIYKTRIWMCAVTGLPYRAKNTWLEPLPILQPLSRQSESRNVQPSTNNRPLVQPWGAQQAFHHQVQPDQYSPYNPYAFGAEMVPPMFGQVAGSEKLSPTLAAVAGPFGPASPLFLYGQNGQQQYAQSLGPGFVLPGQYNRQSFLDAEGPMGPTGAPQTLHEGHMTLLERMQPSASLAGSQGEQLLGPLQMYGVNQYHIKDGDMVDGEGDAFYDHSRLGPAYLAPRDAHKRSPRSDGGPIEDMGSFETSNGFVLQSLVDLINH